MTKLLSRIELQVSYPKPLFVFFMMLWGVLAMSQSPIGRPNITHFSTTDYRAGTQNWAIEQDSKGFMHFGNNKGLLIFDGATWRTISLPNRTIVRSLAVDESGKIFLGSQDELGYFSLDASNLEAYHSLVDLIPEADRAFEDVWRILILQDQVFFCTQKAIFRFQDQHIDVISPFGRFSNFFMLNGQLYAQDNQKGLLVLEGKEMILVPQGSLFKDREIAAILPYQNEQKLIVSIDDGLFLMSESAIQPWNNEASQYLIEHHTYCGIQLKNGHYAIGTPQNGLVIFDAQGQVTLLLNKSKGLQNNTVLSIFQDLHANLWLGLDNGIDYVEINSPFSLIGSEAGVEGAGYASAVQDKQLYLGTNQGLFSFDWKQSNAFVETAAFQLLEASKGQVWSLNHLADQLLVGQHKGAFYIKNKQITPLSTINGAWKLLTLAQDSNYALEGTYSGLLLYEKQNDPNNPWKLLQKLDGFDESARVIEEDENGNIWVSHAYKGVFKIQLDLSNRAIKAVSFYNSKNGLPTDISINVSKIRGEVVFTTPTGVFSYKETTNTFLKHQELNEILGNDRNVHRLIEDQMGNIWFSVDEEFGVLKIREKGVYNKVDRFLFNHIQKDLQEGYEHIYAADPENIFIASGKGFILYNPASDNNFRTPYPTYIRNITLLSETDSVIYPSASTVQNESVLPQFQHHKNNFKFSFSTPFYEQINHVRYRYQLEGFDSEWSDWVEKNEKEYTNLSPGDYRFVVEAQNAYGQNSRADAYAFSICPPWYASWGARISYVFLGLFGLAALMWSNSRRLTRKTQELKQEQAETLEKNQEEFKQKVEKSEAEIIRLRNEKLQADINHKNSELASAAMHLVQKREILQKIKRDLKKIKENASSENQAQLRKLIRTIDGDITLDDTWNQFELYFDKVHENFLKKLREQYPVLTPKDRKLCAYLRMRLSTKEIAPLMNISVRGIEISRYRLRKKLDLDAEVNLIDFMMKV